MIKIGSGGPQHSLALHLLPGKQHRLDRYPVTLRKMKLFTLLNSMVLVVSLLQSLPQTSWIRLSSLLDESLRLGSTVTSGKIFRLGFRFGLSYLTEETSARGVDPFCDQTCSKHDDGSPAFFL